MEELLNKLIEKGWKPFGDEHIHGAIKAMYYVRFLRGRENSDREIYLRQIVSKESGLWQFVCENGMVALKLSARMKNPRIDWEDVDDYNNGHIVMNYKQKCEGDKAGYRIIESSLKDESELEDFLLDNIKIDE